MPRYYDDIRYLRVWVQYADCLPDPGDVFKFLKENEVGQTHALFYIAHATFLELRGSYAAADNVFQQGINRLATPQDRLKAKFDEFQHRMARRIQRKAQEQSSATTEDPDHPERQSLAVLGGRRSVRSAGLASQKRKAIATPGRDNAPAGGSGNGGLEIFVDEEFGGSAGAGGASTSAAAAAAGVGARSAAWTTLPSYEQTRKENTQKATSWAGQRMKQTQAFAAPPAPALSIPLDPEFEEAEQNASRAAATAEARNQVSLRQRLDRGGLDEQLAHDPLRLHRHAPVAAPAPVAAVPVKAAREEILACNKDALEGEDGQEQSFEEVRAKAWLAKKQQDTSMEDAAPEAAEVLPPSPIPISSSIPIAVAVVKVNTNAETPKASPFDQPEYLLGAMQHATTTHPSTSAMAGPFMSSSAVPSGLDNILSSDMTMNTKDAFDAINAAFGGMFGGDAPVLADTEYTMGTGGAGSEPTMTISTKEAFAAINTMFANKSSSFNSANDVTMNTKAAFEALNAAFGGRSAAERAAAGPVPAPQPSASGLFIRQDTSLRTEVDHQPSQSSSSHPALAHAPSSFDIREDTVYINPRSAAAAAAVAEVDAENAGGGLSIREDTIFIRPATSSAAPATGGLAIREDTLFLNNQESNSPSASGLTIREDTIFIKPSQGAAASQATYVEDNDDTDVIGSGGGGLSIREDTIFINRASQQQPAASSGGGGLGIREDTVFLNRGGAEAENIDDDDTVEVGMSNKWGFNPGEDDTLAFNAEEITQALAPAVATTSRPAAGSPTRTPRDLATAAAAAHSTGLSSDLQDLQLASLSQEENEISSPTIPAAIFVDAENIAVGVDAENNENAPPVGMHLQDRAIPRDLRDPAVANLALGPLSNERISKLNVAIETDAEAEAALAALLPEQQLPVGDEFAVYADHDESNHLSQVSQVIDPFSSGFQAYMLSMLSPPVAEWPGVTTITEEEETPALAIFKRMQRVGAPEIQVNLGNSTYSVQRSIGSGAYATVYQALKEEKQGSGGATDVALKVEAPACPWEWYVCKVVSGRVPTEHRMFFLDPYALQIGPGASIMEMPRGTHGSLQDVLNVYLKKGERPEEVVVARLTVNLMHILGDLHASRVLHNDIKPDNVLVCFTNDDDGGVGVGLQLIDFGRSVDLELLPPGSVMCGDCDTEAFRCVEMREERPWLWQADAYGAAGVIHCLLFGEYMEVERVMNAEGSTFLRIKHAFRRYWQGEMWDTVFNKLLNWTCLDAGAPPPWTELATMLETFLDSSKDGQRKEQIELNKLKNAL